MERHRPRLHHPAQSSAAGAPYASSASLRGCRESRMPRRKGPQHPPPPGGPEEPGEKRPKFHLNIRTLTDDMLDKFASIRIPGSKKERPPLPSLKTTFASSDCSAAPLEMMENFAKPLSENELLELFEKMMEDMNLNEDKKAPLREKDFSIKKEMVMQYINTASKTGSLKRSRQISPQEFIHELKMGSADERLVTCLESLRVSLTSNPKIGSKEWGTAVKIPENVEGTLEVGDRQRLEEFGELRRIQEIRESLKLPTDWLNDCDQNADSNIESEIHAETFLDTNEELTGNQSKGHECYGLVNNLAAFCSCPRDLWKVELQSDLGYQM
ncbi:protein diaphanous homolog 3-like [Aotus nancymaae]|uniref:protein diaphanous homolog 3-like n=1 Tax=Aotus nancymaae TaxID=37293 RepID=UPI0030FE8835